MVGADGHDVAGAAPADAPAQVKAAVHLVAGDEPGADAAVVSVLQQAAGQFRLGREHDLLGYSGQLAALFVGGPVRRQVQGPADQRVPGRGRVVRVTATWHRAIPPRVPLYWRAAPAQSAEEPDFGGLVHDQHRVASVLVLPSGQVPDRPVRDAVQHQLLIAASAGQQVLHPVRAGVPGGLGEGPAVVIVQFR